MSGDSDANVFLTQGNEAGVDLLAHGAATSAEMVHSGTGVDQGVDGAGGQDHVSQSTRLHHKMREMKEVSSTSRRTHHARKQLGDAVPRCAHPCVVCRV